MSNQVLENGQMVEKFNIRLKLANKMTPEKQWWVIESTLARAETLGPTPAMKQVNDPANDCVLVFFQMTEEQREDFFKKYPPPKEEAA